MRAVSCSGPGRKLVACSKWEAGEHLMEGLFIEDVGRAWETGGLGVPGEGAAVWTGAPCRGARGASSGTESDAGAVVFGGGSWETLAAPERGAKAMRTPVSPLPFSRPVLLTAYPKPGTRGPSIQGRG